MAGGRKEEGSEAETAASQSGEEQGPSGYGQKVRCWLWQPLLHHLWVLGLLPQPFPSSAAVQRAGSAHGPKFWVETDLRGHLV